MNRPLKIGLIGFSATILLALVLKLVAGISPGYIAPFALPWGMVVIIGAAHPRPPKGRE